jgi:HEAT repeat protein
MFHDTNDSKLRLSVIETLNGLPGVQVYFTEADGRRFDAAGCLGKIGPAAKAAVPDLIKALKGKDAAIRVAAISALGKIRSEPETVVPLLIQYLDDENLDVSAAKALGEFGSLAKPAIPKLLPLLRAKDDDDQAAATEALKKIDPVAAAQAENDLRKEMLENSSTNRPISTGAK